MRLIQHKKALLSPTNVRGAVLSVLSDLFNGTDKNSGGSVSLYDRWVQSGTTEIRDYTDQYSRGNRLSIITPYTNSPLNPGGNIDSSINGDEGLENILYFASTSNVAGRIIQYTFNTPVRITKWQIIEEKAWFAFGVWQPQASNDGVNWDNIGSAAEPPQVNNHRDVSFSSNLLEYTHYRILGVSGAHSQTWTEEMLFEVPRVPVLVPSYADVSRVPRNTAFTSLIGSLVIEANYPEYVRMTHLRDLSTMPEWRIEAWYEYPNTDQNEGSHATLAVAENGSQVAACEAAVLYNNVRSAGILIDGASAIGNAVGISEGKMSIHKKTDGTVTATNYSPSGGQVNTFTTPGRNPDTLYLQNSKWSNDHGYTESITYWPQVLIYDTWDGRNGSI